MVIHELHIDTSLALNFAMKYNGFFFYWPKVKKYPERLLNSVCRTKCKGLGGGQNLYYCFCEIHFFISCKHLCKAFIQNHK